MFQLFIFYIKNVFFGFGLFLLAQNNAIKKNMSYAFSKTIKEQNTLSHLLDTFHTLASKHLIDAPSTLSSVPSAQTPSTSQFFPDCKFSPSPSYFNKRYTIPLTNDTRH